MEEDTPLLSASQRVFRGSETGKYVLYPKRWLMLALFASPSIVNGIMFLGMGSIGDLVEERYNVSSAVVNILGQAFFLMFALFLPGGLAVLNRDEGLRKATLIAAFLNTIGMALRVPSTLVENDSFGFALLITSNLIASSAQPYFLATPAVLSSKWFGIHERGVAIAVGSLCNQFGMALGYFVTRLFVTTENFNDTVLLIHICVACFSTVTTLAAYAFFENDPPTPPSADCNVLNISASSSVKETLKVVVKAVKQNFNRPFLAVQSSFGVSIAIYWSLGLLLDGAMVDDFTSTQIAVTGLCLLTSGIPGMYCAGLLIDRYPEEHRKLLAFFL
eukprot:TRINITY_DN722_c5_g1_i1.p1 TRINITY_DN722_c5_g1~~TRINITY_DN722_c5_g1_i1.p1  ORF type:complete len:348 (+),score=37.92 TRINITY_DN722_c5_g1_i1:51-1046(+)